MDNVFKLLLVTKFSNGIVSPFEIWGFFKRWAAATFIKQDTRGMQSTSNSLKAKCTFPLS